MLLLLESNFFVFGYVQKVFVRLRLKNLLLLAPSVDFESIRQDFDLCYVLFLLLYGRDIRQRRGLGCGYKCKMGLRETAVIREKLLDVGGMVMTEQGVIWTAREQ